MTDRELIENGGGDVLGAVVGPRALVQTNQEGACARK
jgi:hypothetical protein